MDENLHNIEKLFRDGLEDNEEVPSAQVWDGIDNVLNKDNIVSIKKSYTVLKRVAQLLLFLLSGLGIYEISSRQNNQEIVNPNNNNSKTETINNSSNHEKKSPYSKHSQKAIDSISVDNENIVIDSSVVNKNTSPHNPLFKQGNRITVENKTASDNTPPSSKRITTPDANADISIVNKDIPERKNTANIRNNTIADNTIASGNKQKIGSKSSYKAKKDSPKITEGNQQPLVNNGGIDAKQKLPLLRRLNPAPIDKINRSIKDSVETKKLVERIAINKIITSNNTINVVASNTKMKYAKPSRFSITPFFSPDIAWYRLQEDKPDNQPDNLAEIEKSEKHEFSSTFGALVNFNLNKYWSLQSGLTFSNTDITVEPKTIYAQSDNTGDVKYRINTSSGYGYVLPSFSSNPAVGDSLYAFTSTHTLQYVGIPVALKYNTTKGKFSFYVLAGVSTNFLTRGKIETSVEKGVDNETEVVDNLKGLKKNYFSGFTSLGVDYKLNKKMALSFAPTFRFALGSINQDAPVKSYPNTLGSALGLRIGL